MGDADDDLLKLVAGGAPEPRVMDEAELARIEARLHGVRQSLAGLAEGGNETFLLRLLDESFAALRAAWAERDARVTPEKFAHHMRLRDSTVEQALERAEAAERRLTAAEARERGLQRTLDRLASPEIVRVAMVETMQQAPGWEIGALVDAAMRAALTVAALANPGAQEG